MSFPQATFTCLQSKDSFYREIVLECELQEASVESLCKSSHGLEVQVSKTKKSYSLSDLSLDCMQSSDAGSFPDDLSMEKLKTELRDLFAKKRSLKGSFTRTKFTYTQWNASDGSKSFDSLIHANLSKSTPATFFAPNLSLIEQSMNSLEISEHDVQRAQKLKGQFLHALEEVSLSDVCSKGKYPLCDFLLLFAACSKYTQNSKFLHIARETLQGLAHAQVSLAIWWWPKWGNVPMVH